MSRPILGGSVDQSTIIRIIDSTDGSPETGVVASTDGLALWYRREGAAIVALTESDLAAADSAHSDGGMIHLDDGMYRVDLPDAAVAAGAGGVMIGGTVTGMIVLPSYHPIDPPVDVRLVAGTEASVGTDPPTAAEILSEFGTGSTLTALVTATSVTVSDKTGFSLTTAYDLYHADIQLTKDDANSQDEWTVTWFKNGVRVSSGITVPTIQVIKRADGTDLVAAASMTQIGTTGSYKYDEATNRITAGEAVLAVATATIDASSRSFSKLITRDSP